MLVFLGSQAGQLERFFKVIREAILSVCRLLRGAARHDSVNTP
jgi:hypothetical protein